MILMYIAHKNLFLKVGRIKKKKGSTSTSWNPWGGGTADTGTPYQVRRVPKPCDYDIKFLYNILFLFDFF